MVRSSLIRTFWSLVLVVVVLVTAGIAAPAHAGGCFGKLSDQTPCFKDSRSGDRSAARSRVLAPPTLMRLPKETVSSMNALMKRPLNAQIVNPQLKRLPDRRGEWSGVVTGFGTAVLYLQFTKASKLLEELRLGSVELTGAPVPFKLRSELPKVSDWEWRVVIKAR